MKILNYRIQVYSTGGRTNMFITNLSFTNKNLKYRRDH